MIRCGPSIVDKTKWRRQTWRDNLYQISHIIINEKEIDGPTGFSFGQGCQQRRNVVSTWGNSSSSPASCNSVQGIISAVSHGSLSMTHKSRIFKGNKWQQGSFLHHSSTSNSRKPIPTYQTPILHRPPSFSCLRLESSFVSPSSLYQLPFSDSHRRLSSSSSKNDDRGEIAESSSDGKNIIESAAATAQWKRSQYRKIESKFVVSEIEPSVHDKKGLSSANCSQNEHNQKINKSHTSVPPGTLSPSSSLPPLNIENYEDVQPMWKEMESRVTRRRSLTLEQRGGVSGRRNVRRSDEDVWLEAGVYESPDPSADSLDSFDESENTNEDKGEQR